MSARDVILVMFAVVIQVLPCDILEAATTIDPVNKYAFGANIGWADWSGGTSQPGSGAVIGAYVSSGHIYSANVGWINLGSGSPVNGIQYQNNGTTDFGVNQDGLGNLRGYAYGANVGWINFEDRGSPTVNMATGQMSGYIWGANCGWISLSNAYAFVQTDEIYPGMMSTNGLPVAWLLNYFGTTNVNAEDDPTGKGMTIFQDYLAGTDPTNAESIFEITGQTLSQNGFNTVLTWSSVPTRYYYIEQSTNVSQHDWTTNAIGLISPQGSSTTSSTLNTLPLSNCFFRIEAVRPLTP